jgi:hypothetical protein
MTTESILASWGVTKYTIYKDGSVDILQDLDLRDKLTTPEFPIKIRKVTGYLDLRNTPITSLGALESVGSNLDLSNSRITSLGALKSVGDYLDLGNSRITSLGILESVGGFLDLQNTPITSLGALKSVGGYLVLHNTPITSLGALESVGGALDLTNTPITSLGALKSVSWCLYTDGNKEYEDWEVFQRELESYKSKLSESPEDAPLMLALTEYQWQRACCEEILGG